MCISKCCLTELIFKKNIQNWPLKIWDPLFLGQISQGRAEPQYFNLAQKLIFEAFYYDTIDYNKWSF